MIVEISEHGSVLKRNHDCFIVQTSTDKIEIPAEKVDAIIITANALVSTQAVALTGFVNTPENTCRGSIGRYSSVYP